MQRALNSSLWVQYTSFCGLLLLTSCLLELDVPKEAVIACRVDTDCPSDQRCVPTTLKCLPRSIQDVEAPSLLGEARITPALGRVGAELSLVFEVGEELERLPEVTFFDGDEEKKFSHVEGELNGREYKYSYVAEGGETEGAHPLQVTLIDLVGNRSVLSIGRSVVFDFRPPTVVVDSPLLELRPDTNSFVSSPKAAREDTQVIVRFASDESLAQDPQIYFVDSENDIQHSLDAQNVGGFSYALTWDFAGEVDDGQYTLEIDLEDEAGNNARLPLEGLILDIDTQAPNAPPTASGLMLHRNPWGKPDTNTDAFLGLEALNAFGESGDSVLVFRNDEALAANVVLTLQSDELAPNGEMIELPLDDRTVLYLTTMDDAGNLADADVSQEGIQLFDVKNVTWVAALGRKQFAQSIDNPHVLFESRSPADGPWSKNDRELFPPSLLAQRGDGELLSSKGVFQRRAFRSTEPARPQNSALAYDPMRGQTLLNAGGDTWIWNGLGWELSVSFERPTGLMAYDPNTSGIILFDGSTWRWDGQQWLRFETLNSPGAGARGLSYDPVNRGVLYLGQAGTWVFDGKDWEILDADTYLGRENMALAADVLGQKVVAYATVFDTSSFPFVMADELWTWDGSAWSFVCSGGCGGPGFNLFGYAAATREEGGVHVIHPTFDGHWRLENDIFNTEAATPIQGVGSTSTPYASAAFDSGRSELLVYTPDTNASRVLYGKNDLGWRAKGFEQSPIAFSGGEAVFDAIGERILLLAGSPATLWEFSDGVFNSLGVAPFSVPERGLDMAVDNSLVYAYLGPNLYTWDGSAWDLRCDGSPLSDTCSNLSGGEGAAIAYDGARSKLMVFGGEVGMFPGSFLGSTQSFDGSDWIEECALPGCTEPPPRSRSAMVYDAAREVVVLFGGCADFLSTSSAIVTDLSRTCGSVLNDHWEWDGGVWTQRCTGNNAEDDDFCGARPAARQMHDLEYIDKGGMVLLEGGQGPAQFGLLSDRWLFDGARWTQLETTGIHAGPRTNAARVWDPVNQRQWRFGGASTTTQRYSFNPAPALESDIEYIDFGVARIDHRFEVYFPAAGLSEEVQLMSMRGSWWGGIDSPNPLCQQQTTLRTWLGDAWGDELLLTTRADGLDWETDVQEDIENAIRSDGVISMVASLSGHGCSENVMSTDAVSLTLQYLRP